MESSKLERTIFILLRVFGVLGIIGGFLGKDGLFSNEGLVVYKHATIIGNVFMLSPRVMVEMLVSIILYLVFVKILSSRIRILKRER